jgi:hypothetical protein
MKTGRLLKFNRPGGEVQAYVYSDHGQYHAALYLLSHDRARSSNEPLERFSHASEAGVERAVREWVDAHFPRGS